MPPSLSDKLKALGVKTGAADLTPPPPKTPSGVPIEVAVDGRWCEGRGGPFFVAEQVFAADYRHGLSPIRLESPLAGIAAWAQDSRIAGIKPESLIFLDTETSGLAGGTGTYAFMVGAGKFVEGDFKLSIFFMRDPAEERGLLEGLADFLAGGEALVTFNGKAFDAPLLRTRYTLHSIPNPFADFAHIDLLPLARRLWRDRLPSRALKYLEENVLGAPRSSEEVPGYEIPWLYFDYLRTGNAMPLKGVFYHNAMDVVAMAALLALTSHMLDDPHHAEIEHGLDVVALAKLLEDLGRWDEAAQLFERGLSMGLQEADFWTAVRRLAVLQRRRGDLEKAVDWWTKAAGEGHVYAHIELAKHYEHRMKQRDEALKWTLSAQAIIDSGALPKHEAKYWREELEKRRERLQKKK
jgi:uncharacterized protein YprB with RNaseH-like and TPR domain